MRVSSTSGCKPIQRFSVSRSMWHLQTGPKQRTSHPGGIPIQAASNNKEEASVVVSELSLEQTTSSRHGGNFLHHREGETKASWMLVTGATTIATSQNGDSVHSILIASKLTTPVETTDGDGSESIRPSVELEAGPPTSPNVSLHQQPNAHNGTRQGHGSHIDSNGSLYDPHVHPSDAGAVDTTASTASMSSLDEALSRGKWLLGLLVLQSTSSFVLDAYQDLLRDHLVVTLFLTMLVGAGGNAGNQSAIKVIRGLATGSIKPSWQSARNTLAQQSSVGLMLGTGLSLGGFIRVYLTNGDIMNSAAISLSLFSIVMTSVLLGSGLPFALAKAGIDPANAGTTIQVLMDILGVAITCVTCQLVLEQFAHGVGLAT